MTDDAVLEEEEAPEAYVPSIVVQLGNDNSLVGNGPEVTTVTIPQGKARWGGDLYTFPEVADDAVFAAHPATAHMAEALNGVPEASRAAVRRALIDGQYAHPSGVKALPFHEAATVVIHPAGAWRAVAGDATPSWLSCPGHPGYEKFLADYFGCSVGVPSDVEDRYWTRHGSGLYAPGSIPDPWAGITAMHTTYGVLNQEQVMGGYSVYAGGGTYGTASAANSTSLTGSTESGGTHASNDCAGQYLVVGPNASGAGSKVWGLILSNTSGTTPVYTVDQWYAPNTPGGAAGTPPNATSFYQVMQSGPPAQFVALTSNSTSPSYGGSGGTADAATLAQTLTSEFTQALVSGTGLSRKIGVVTVSGYTWINTVTFTATSADQVVGAQTVAKAALCNTIVPADGGLTYMTLVSPTATLTATGDALTLTWTFTETHS